MSIFYLSEFIENLSNYMRTLDGISSSSLNTFQDASILSLNIKHLDEIPHIIKKIDTSSISYNSHKDNDSVTTEDTSEAVSPNSESSVNTWSRYCDKLLTKIANTYFEDWKKIQRRMFKLSGSKFSVLFLKEKFRAIKNKSCQNKGHFKHGDDLKLVEAYLKFGTDWDRISSYLGDRSQIMVKNRFYYLKRNCKIEKLKTTLDEQELAKYMTNFDWDQ